MFLTNLNTEIAACILLLLLLLERLSMTLRQTANGKNETFVVFSCLYNKLKIFSSAVNSRIHLSIFVWFI